MPQKLVEFLERDGKVYRRVTRDLVGVRVVTSEMEVSDDPVAYAETIAPMRILGYHSRSSIQVKEPQSMTVADLAVYLGSVDSIDVLLRMRKLDPRKTSIALYEDRLNAILDAEFNVPQDDQNDNPTE